MEFVRAVDFDRAEVQLAGGYRGQFLFAGESCFVIATKVPPGAAGPGRHVHVSDQIYVVLDGTIDLSLGAREAQVTTGSAVVIPAGLPHQNWNRGPVDEVHLEVIAPGIPPVTAVALASERADEPGLTPAFCSPDPSKAGSGGFSQDWFVDRSHGSPNAAICIAEVPPQQAGPPLHVHEFDQFYFVLAGVLEVEVGFSHYSVPPFHLVVLPAQVPHRQWNEGEVLERHLTIVVPEPAAPHSPDQPWDVAVTLQTTGEPIA